MHQVTKCVMDDPNIRQHYDKYGHWKIETVDKKILSFDEINSFALHRLPADSRIELCSGVCQKCGLSDAVFQPMFS